MVLLISLVIFKICALETIYFLLETLLVAKSLKP
jgi:hypothetical protein